MRIELHVERLVLEGVPRADAERVVRALTRELEARLAAGDLPAGLRRGQEVPRLDAGRVRLGEAARPESTGSRLADAVHGALKR